MSTRFVGSDVARLALRAIDKLQRKAELDAEEAAAVERLCSWLSQGMLHQGDDDDGDDDDASALDETQREFLLSYRLPAGADGGACGARRQYILPQRAARHQQHQQQQQQQQQDGDGGYIDDGSGDMRRGVGESGRGAAAAATLSHSDVGGEAADDPQLLEQMQALEDWQRFDVFKLAQLTGGRPLQTVALALLRRRGLVARLALPEDRLRAYLADVEAAYLPHNPYHNSTHAADVVQALGAMLAADGWAAPLSDLEQLALVLAAATHDVGHPGVNNDFLIRTQSEAAVAYNDQSINENMHAAAGFKLLAKRENNFLAGLPPEDFCRLRRLVIHIILSTDMARHRDGLQEFGAALRRWGPDLGAWPPESRPLALQQLVHAADISNPARPLRFCREWGQRVHDEFFAQGDKEAALGLPVSSICDRSKASVAQSQWTFVEYIVKPCFSAISELAPNFVGMTQLHIDAALQYWQQEQHRCGVATAAVAEAPADGGGG